MEKLEVTSLSSRGQVVIPQGVRGRLKLRTGEKFVVIGENDTIVLKKLETPSFDGFDKLLRKTREFAKKQDSLLLKKVGSLSWKQVTKPLRESKKRIKESEVPELVRSIRKR